MSRQYLNEKYCVRCNRKTVGPYLQRHYDLLVDIHNGKKMHFKVLDVSCGNGRNSEWMKSLGHDVVSLDMVNDYGRKCILGQDKIPLPAGSVDVVLCNYLLMFLDRVERNQVLDEIQRVAVPGCKIMVELYPAKDSFATSAEDMVVMQKEIFDKLSWKKLRYSKGKFIAENV